MALGCQGVKIQLQVTGSTLYHDLYCIPFDLWAVTHPLLVVARELRTPWLLGSHQKICNLADIGKILGGMNIACSHYSLKQFLAQN